MPKAIEVTCAIDQKTPDWITLTATVTGVACSCGMFLPLPPEAGRYGMVCPICERHHFVEVETEESVRVKEREKRWDAICEPSAQRAKRLGEL